MSESHRVFNSMTQPPHRKCPSERQQASQHLPTAAIHSSIRAKPFGRPQTRNENALLSLDKINEQDHLPQSHPIPKPCESTPPKNNSPKISPKHVQSFHLRHLYTEGVTFFLTTRSRRETANQENPCPSTPTQTPQNLSNHRRERGRDKKTGHSRTFGDIPDIFRTHCGREDQAPPPGHLRFFEIA
jgi:hypothetical protein